MGAIINNLFSVLLAIYLSTLCIVAAIYAWYIVRQFDRYVWQACEWWDLAKIAVVTILWPVILFLRPQALYRPSIVLPVATEEAARLRLWHSPPHCSNFVSYRGFTFLASDVEAALNAKIGRSRHLANNDEGALLRWVEGRVETDRNPTPVPDAWKRFVYIAGELAHSCKGEVYCSPCGLSVPSSDLTGGDEYQPGSIVQRLRCPNGHVVFEAEVMEINGWENESEVPDLLKKSMDNTGRQPPM